MPSSPTTIRRQGYVGTAGLASVFRRTTAEAGPGATMPRRVALPGPVSTARAPARDAAPLGPALIPAAARSATARWAAASLTATAASSPARRYGQAAADTVPQFSPAMIVAAVGTDTGVPAWRLASRHAAVSGSTASSDVRWGRGAAGSPGGVSAAR